MEKCHTSRQECSNQQLSELIFMQYCYCHYPLQACFARKMFMSFNACAVELLNASLRFFPHVSEAINQDGRKCGLQVLLSMFRFFLPLLPLFLRWQWSEQSETQQFALTMVYTLKMGDTSLLLQKETVNVTMKFFQVIVFCRFYCWF